MSTRRAERKASPLFEIARVLVRLDHVARHRKRESQHHVNGCEIFAKQNATAAECL